MRGLALWLGVCLPSAPDEAPVQWVGRYPNVELTTHEGKTVRFYDDLVKGRIVLINFMYVECEGTCPGTTTTLVRVGKELGERMGKEVLILSLTLQPKVDTPERLKAYAGRYQAGPGVLFLTGAPEQVELVRTALGFAYPDDPARDADRTQHMGLIRAGNVPQNLWGAIPSASSPAQVAALVRLLGAPGERPSPAVVTRPFVDPADRQAMETMVEGLEALHMRRMELRPEAYEAEATGLMAQFLGMEAKGAEALRVGLRKIVKETEAARRAAQEARSRLVYDESDPASVARYRDQWRRFVDERARIASGLDGLLDSSPRSKLFRAHAARWIHFLEDHPDPHPAPEQQK